MLYGDTTKGGCRMKKARALVALVAALLLCSVVTLAASGALEGETAGEPAAQPPEKVAS